MTKSKITCLRADPFSRKFLVTNGDGDGALRIKALSWQRAIHHANTWANSIAVDFGDMPPS